MTKSEARSALDREFNSTKMHLDVYTARVKEIDDMPHPIVLAAPPEQPAPAKSFDEKFVTYGFLRNFATKVGQKLRSELAPTKSTAADLAALQQRVSTLEVRCGALAMAAGRSNPDGLAELEKLFARVGELESKPSLKYCGIFDEKGLYREGEFVTHSGSLWAAREPTRSRPGTDQTWQLCVKRGANGKDAR